MPASGCDQGHYHVSREAAEACDDRASDARFYRHRRSAAEHPCCGASLDSAHKMSCSVGGSKGLRFTVNRSEP